MRTRRHLQLTLTSLCLVGTLSALATPAHAAPSPDLGAGAVTSAQQALSTAADQATAARAKADDIEHTLGQVSDAHQESLGKHERDVAQLASVRTQLRQAQDSAKTAQHDLGRMANSMYRSGSLASMSQGASLLLGQTDPGDIVANTHYLKAVGQDSATTLGNARTNADRVDALSRQAATLEATSAQAEKDLAAQVTSVQQMSTEAESAYTRAQQLTEDARQQLAKAQADAERQEREARQRAEEAAQAAAAAQARADVKAAQTARAAQASAESDGAAARSTQSRLQRAGQALPTQDSAPVVGAGTGSTGTAAVGTSDWTGYLAKLQAAGITPPSRAQLNNRASWDASWQPVGSQRGVAQVQTPAGPLLILSAETITAINTAFTKLGTPYLWGGTGPRYDCSGLTMTSYRAAGITIPRTSGAQAASGAAVPLSAAVPGDLVFFGSPVYHVGIYLGDGMMLHAPRTGDVVKVAKMFATPVKVIRPSVS